MTKIIQLLNNIWLFTKSLMTTDFITDMRSPQKNIIFERINNQRGNVIFIVTFGFTSLLGMTGLVIDGGMLYMEKTQLQKTANAAVLSGAQELTAENEVEVSDIVAEVLAYHEVEGASVENLSVVLEKSVGLELKKEVSMAFMKLLGIDSVDVSATAVAGIGIMGRAAGAAPLGIDESIDLNFHDIYELKVDEDAVETGNFGVLALEGTGAKTYEETLKTGSDEEFQIGDIVDTQTGNIAGPTKKATDYLISQCDDPDDRSCPRTILIPVYKPYDYDQNQMKQIEITGFAYFYLTEPMDDEEKTIKGKFIKRTGPGYENLSAVNRGAFSIRLTE